MFVLCLANNAPGLLFYGVAFFEDNPTYFCTYNLPQYVGHQPDVVTSSNFDGFDGSTQSLATTMGLGNTFTYTVPCERETVCAHGDEQDLSLIGYSLNSEATTYIYNWIEQLNLYCTPSIYIGLSGALTFAGIAISCFFAPTAGDKYGRKIVWMLSCAVNIPMILATALTSYLGVGNFALFYLGMEHIGRYVSGYILITECVPKKHQAMAGTILMTGDVLATFYIAFFLRFIANNA